MRSDQAVSDNEDREDLRLALEALADATEPILDWAELREELLAEMETMNPESEPPPPQR